jgi:hypothetical protein
VLIAINICSPPKSILGVYNAQQREAHALWLIDAHMPVEIGADSCQVTVCIALM